MRCAKPVAPSGAVATTISAEVPNKGVTCNEKEPSAPAVVLPTTASPLPSVLTASTSTFEFGAVLPAIVTGALLTTVSSAGAVRVRTAWAWVCLM